MPMLDGYQTSMQIRDHYKEKQIEQPMIIACTGHTEPEFIAKAWRHQINEVLSKPLNIKVTKAILKEFIMEL